MTGDFRSHFMMAREAVFLNAAYMTPMPVIAGQAGVGAIEARTAGVWNVSPSDFFEPSEKLRALVGGLWGTLPRNIALVPSVSYGVETAVKNLRLAPGAEILVPQDDFPSDIYPWIEAAKTSGARVAVVSRPADFDWTRAFLERLAVAPPGGVVSVPLCDWSDGTRFDLSAISGACRSTGTRLVVDVSQAFGAVPFTLADFDPDFVFSVGYKWQLGPYGLSYLYVADRWLDGVPLENGWINRRASEDFARLVEYRDDFQDGARKFDAGQRSQFQLTPMALESMRLLRELTIPAIHSHVRALVVELHECLHALGFLVPPLELLAGHMIGARHRNWPDIAPLVKRLRDRGIYVSARGNAMRISPHLYNDREDIERFLAVLAEELSPAR